MRRAMILSIAVLMLLAIPAVANGAEAGDYEGTWNSKDVDQSNQVLTITDNGDGSLDLLLLDDGGSICGNFGPGGRPTTSLVATAEGAIVGGVLHVDSYLIDCDGQDPFQFDIDIDYVLRGSGRSMFDTTGVRSWRLVRNP